MNAVEVSKKADQVEVKALLEKYAEASVALDDEIISGTIEDLMVEDEGMNESGHWSVLDTYTDSQQDRIMQELNERNCLLGDTYPFDLKHSRLKYKHPGNRIYEALLLVSLTTQRQGQYWLRLAKSFEKLSAWAVKLFFQCDKVWLIGDPNVQIKQEIRRIYAETGELQWNPDLNFSTGHIKDAGLDFISYRRLDRRVGGLFYFGQSACGENWIDKTGKNLKLKKIKRLVRMPYADPVKLFTIPYLITNDEETMIKAANNFSGLIFDRARLTQLLTQIKGDKDVDKEINKVYNLAHTKCN